MGSNAGGSNRQAIVLIAHIKKKKKKLPHISKLATHLRAQEQKEGITHSKE